MEGVQLIPWARRCSRIKASFRHIPLAATDVKALANTGVLHVTRLIEFLVVHPHPVDSFVRVLCLQDLEGEYLLEEYRNTIRTALLEAELSFEDLCGRLLTAVPRRADMPTTEELDWPMRIAQGGKQGQMTGM